jgi:RND family efflux transporter MFP subunit
MLKRYIRRMNGGGGCAAKVALPFVLITALLLISGCTDKDKGKGQQPPPPSVTVAQPLKKAITEWQVFTGRLDSVNDVEIRARVSGYLDKVHFDDGEVVKKGDLLFTIDQRPFQAAVDQAEAAFAQANAALTLAESNLMRASRLIKENAISRQDYDLRTSEAEQAAANTKAAEAALTQARLELEYTEVRSPIEGVAGDYLVTAGNLVSGGAGGGAVGSTLLTTVVPHRPIYAYFEIDESSVLANVRRIMAGRMPGRGEPGSALPVQMQLRDETGFPHKGVFDFVDNRLDRETATLTARARFENEDRFLTPGLFARIRMQTTDEYDAILIPDKAVGTLQTKKFVWIVDSEGKAERRIIETGSLHEGMRIVRSGLEGSERVIIAGLQQVRPGSPLTVEETTLSLAGDGSDRSDGPAS